MGRKKWKVIIDVPTTWDWSAFLGTLKANYPEIGYAELKEIGWNPSPDQPSNKGDHEKS